MLAYKFRSNIDIRQDTFSLLENKLYASKLSQLNDPFEQTILDSITTFAKKDNVYKDIENLLKKIKEEIGIYSLSIDKTDEKIVLNDLMWAHYANSHKGFCIEYDINILRDSLKLGLLENVDIYNVKYDNIDIKNIAHEGRGKNPKETLLTFKSPSWSYESEMRLIFDKSGIKQYNSKALKSIYFGLNMGSKEREIIMSGLKNRKTHVDFYEMQTTEDEYKLKYEPIKSSEVYQENLLPQDMYEIIGEPETLKTVQNFNVLYKGSDKSKHMLESFVAKFRDEHALKPSNITIVDDKKVIELLDTIRKPVLTDKEEKELAEHWIALSTFDAPEHVWLYPNKQK